MEFKRGDTVTHRLIIPVAAYQAGLKIYFMAKEEPDDDSSDAKALILREFGDSDITTKTAEAVTYGLKFLPADTNSIQLKGDSKITLKGEFEFRYTDGRVKTFPDKGTPIKVIVYADIRRGNG